MAPRPMPWGLLATFAALWLYGFWPALNPDHFRETCVRYFRPRPVGETVAPSSTTIRLFGLVWVALLGLVLAIVVGSRLWPVRLAASELSGGQAAPNVQGLRLSASRLISIAPRLTSRKYCVGDEELNSLQLRVRFAFTNRGTTPIVVYFGAPFVERTNVAKNADELRAGRYETEVFPSAISADGAAVRIDARFFITLRPGSTHTFEYPAVIALPTQAETGRMSGIVRPGSHVLRLNLRLWPDDAGLSAAWAERVSSKGALLTEPLATEVVALQIEDRPKLIRCD